VWQPAPVGIVPAAARRHDLVAEWRTRGVLTSVVEVPVQVRFAPSGIRSSAISSCGRASSRWRPFTPACT
jgi:hypothetical protein